MNESVLAPVCKPSWSWGSLLPAVGYGRCYRCRRPWWAVSDLHYVEYKPGGCSLALCEWCWGRSDATLRTRAHLHAISLGVLSVEARDALLAAVDDVEREVSASGRNEDRS